MSKFDEISVKSKPESFDITDFQSDQERGSNLQPRSVVLYHCAATPI